MPVGMDPEKDITSASKVEYRTCHPLVGPADPAVMIPPLPMYLPMCNISSPLAAGKPTSGFSEIPRRFIGRNEGEIN